MKFPRPNEICAACGAIHTFSPSRDMTAPAEFCGCGGALRAITRGINPARCKSNPRLLFGRSPNFIGLPRAARMGRY